MRLPSRERAVVPEAKVTQYLLSVTHSYGRHKAAFFKRFGFDVASWEVLAAALVAHAEQYDVIDVADTQFGSRYTVEGELRTPDGRDPMVRVVWFVEKGEDWPRLVTAYPLGGGMP